MSGRPGGFRYTIILAVTGLLLFGGMLPPQPLAPEASAATVRTLPGDDGFNGPGAEFDNITVAGKGQNASLVLNVTGDWLEQCRGTSPPPRYGAAMSSIGDAGNVLLFGGHSGTGYRNDTWLFDPAGMTWTQVPTTTAPCGRYRAAMASVGTDDKVVLFGGTGPGSGDDTWIFDLSDLEWRLLDPPTRPPARLDHAMASFTNDPRVVLFGGNSASGSPASDTWLFNAASCQWFEVQRPENPPPRARCAMAGRPGTDEAVMFGGAGDAGGLDDTWVFDIGDLQWRNLAPVFHPRAMQYPAMAALPGKDRLLMYCTYLWGYLNTSDPETWTYDPANNTWMTLKVTENPGQRMFAGMAPTVDGAVLLFGGERFYGHTNGLPDTWLYSVKALPPAGIYRTPFIDTGEVSNLLSVIWSATLPAVARIEYQLRTASSLEALAQTAFTGPDGTNRSVYNARFQAFDRCPVERWLQLKMNLYSAYRLYSPVISKIDIKYDLWPRAPALLSPANGGWTNLSRPQFTWTFSDGDSESQGAFELQLSPTGRFDQNTLSTGEVYTSATSYTPEDALADGDWFWRVRTRDPEGSWGPFSSAWKFSLDTDPPQDVLVVADPAGWSEGPFTLDFSSSDLLSGIAGYELRLDGTDIGPVTAPHVLAGMADGIHEAVVYAVDLAGNRASGSCKLYVDRDPPIPFTPVADPPGWTNGPVQVAYSTSDAGIGVARYDVRLDDGDFQARPSPWALMALADGMHTVTVRAYDRLGHHTDAVVSVYQDKAPPANLAVAGAPEGWTASVPILDILAQDNLSGMARFEMSVNGGDYSVVPSPVIPQGLVEGNNSVAVRAYDNAGNRAETLVHVLLDSIAPAPFQPAADPPGWTNRPPLVRFAAVDNGSGIDRYEAELDLGNIKAATSPFEVRNLTDGEHSVTIRAFDRAQNSRTGSVQVLYDATPPTASLQIARGPGGKTSPEVTLSINASDACSGAARMCFSNDGKKFSPWEPYNSTRAWRLAPGDGEKRVFVRVSDAAGNEGAPVSAKAELAGQGKVPSYAIGVAALVLLAAALVAWGALGRARRGA